MKRFKFRFEALEKKKKDDERKALKEFASEQQNYRNEILKKEELIHKMEESLKRRENLANEAVPPNVFSLEEDYIQGLKQHIHQADNRISKAQKNLEKAFGQYIRSRQEMEKIKKLKENEYNKYREEIKKKRDKELNDIYTMRDRLKKKAG